MFLDDKIIVVFSYPKIKIFLPFHIYLRFVQFSRYNFDFAFIRVYPK